MGTRIVWRRFFYTTLRYMCTWRNWNHQHHHPTTSMKPNSGSCSSTSEKHPQVWFSFWDLLPWHTDDSRCLQRWFHTACSLKILKHHRVYMCLLLSLCIIFPCSRTHYLCELRTLQPRNTVRPNTVPLHISHKFIGYWLLLYLKCVQIYHIRGIQCHGDERAFQHHPTFIIIWSKHHTRTQYISMHTELEHITSFGVFFSPTLRGSNTGSPFGECGRDLATPVQTLRYHWFRHTSKTNRIESMFHNQGCRVDSGGQSITCL